MLVVVCYVVCLFAVVCCVPSFCCTSFSWCCILFCPCLFDSNICFCKSFSFALSLVFLVLCLIIFFLSPVL